MLNQGDSSYITAQFVIAIQEVSYEYMRPSVVFRPNVHQDGDQFCCLLGKDLQEGLAAFGNTPNEATRNFDVAWYKRAKEEK